MLYMSQILVKRNLKAYFFCLDLVFIHLIHQIMFHTIFSVTHYEFGGDTYMIDFIKIY